MTNTPADLDGWLKDAKERLGRRRLRLIAEQVGRVEAVADGIALCFRIAQCATGRARALRARPGRLRPT